MKIAILDTGGSFGKEYETGAGSRTFVFNQVSAVQKIVDRLQLRSVTVRYDLEHAKDSLDMTDDDRHRIAEWCAEQARCVVVHGTDTMVDSARVAARYCRSMANVVVFTGALLPASMRDTDAELNLGTALGAMQVALPGVYVAMGGRVYPWDQCQKDRATGYFQPK